MSGLMATVVVSLLALVVVMAGRSEVVAVELLPGCRLAMAWGCDVASKAQ